MSDESAQSGYDDILSSVRRIVSTEVNAAADTAAGKLLLTPALRVPAEDGAPEPSQPERDYPTLEDRIADLEAAVGSEAAEWEPDGSEDQTQHEPDAVVLPLRRDAAGAPVDPDDTSDGDVVADAVDAPAPETAALARDTEDAAFEDAMDQASQDHMTPAPANSPQPRDPVAAPLATFRHRGARSDTTDNVLAEDEPTLLDETGLRELVAEIVREELQGGLGERITRNVRKLVRAEIQRAFAARDLD
ncbi:MAG: hypothetical protein AAGM21_12430 [Pseudomonadota bacterium]